LPNRSAKKSVLLVEDDAVSATALKTLLLYRGFDVSVANTVAQGLARLSASKPDYVILDLMLPDGSGEKILRHIRDNRLPITVAVTTASSDDDHLAVVGSLRPDSMIKKPIDLAQLMRALGYQA